MKHEGWALFFYLLSTVTIIFGFWQFHGMHLTLAQRCALVALYWSGQFYQFGRRCDR